MLAHIMYHSVRCADDSTLVSTGKGNVLVKFPDQVIKPIIGVTLVPGLATNLISVLQLAKKGFTVVFGSTST
jgi:hypothetical protein